MVEAFLLHQLIMCASFYNGSIFNNKNEIGIANRAQAMRDHEAGAPLHQSVHRGLNAHLGSCIHAARRFIQDQDRRIC